MIVYKDSVPENHPWKDVWFVYDGYETRVVTPLSWMWPAITPKGWQARFRKWRQILSDYGY